MDLHKVMETVPVLSLIVAALAVFVGPVIGWIAGRQQMQASLAVANKQILAPMRQAWINQLRDNVAEFVSKTMHYYVAGFDDRTDAEYQKLELLENRIALMVNVDEPDHKELLEIMRRAISALERGHNQNQECQFLTAHDALVPLSRKILRREWGRVKGHIETGDA